ncbi:MAG: TonB-dependent receptor, partial [Gemmatimonadota bacterium]|nr:TonB-dependent receptor [Gemmatimonadota bacterium]
SDFSFGMQLNAYRFESLQANGEGLTTSGTRAVSSAAVTRGFEGFSEQNSLGFFVQEQLGFADRLFVTGAVRVDDNSAFGQDFTTVVYPKAQVAYVISEEPFFNVAAFDQLKLRAAYGKAGNAPNPFSAEQNFAPTTVTLADGTSVSAITASAFGNPDLKAETGREIELGFDAAMFGGRAGVEATYYNKRMQDALLSVPVPPSSGFSGSRLTNAGETANTGFELALFGTPVSGRALSWDTRVSASWNRNELLSFGGTRDTPIQFGAFATVQRHQEGFPLAGYWGQDVIRDAAGNPVLTASGRVSLDTALYIGSSVPTREISLANTFTLFRNVQLYGFLDYKGGHYMWNAISYIRNRNDLNSFEVNNPDADPVDVAIRRSGATTPFIQKADFVKLRELSVAYTVPGGWTQRLGVERTTVSLAGRNLAIWTDYEGADPELNFSGNADFTRSDYASVPMIRRVVASVNFSF